jgi:DNA polymerase III psi subunit
MALARRHAYLHALGIQPLVLRVSPEHSACVHPPAAAGSELSDPCLRSLHLGPGDGNILLVCNSPAEAASRLAADIARALDSEPVWSWPKPAETGPAETGPGLTLQQIIERRLFTRVLIFGNQGGERDSELASYRAGEVDANIIASARILRTRSIAELEQSAGAKRALWSELCVNDWCAVRAGKA